MKLRPKIFRIKEPETGTFLQLFNNDGERITAMPLEIENIKILSESLKLLLQPGKNYIGIENINVDRVQSLTEQLGGFIKFIKV